IDGVSEEELSKLVKGFYDDVLKNILYEDAIKMMRDLKSQGFKIYLISASPEFYLNEFYDIKKLIK
ncbi:MAG: hypothetical protein RR587_15625, partial [Solibacillus sp.]